MRKLSRAILTQLLGFALLGLALVGLSRFLPVAGWISHLQHKIVAMEMWGAVLYPLLYAGCNVLLLPGGILAVGGGLFFGLWWGTFLVLLGNVVGAAIAFLISRKLGRGWLENKFKGSRRFKALDTAIRREGWKIIFLSQVHPLFPTSLLNYLYGVTSIRFWPCMLWVALGQLPGLFLYAYLGTLAQLGIKLFRGQTHPVWSEYLIWFGGLLLTVIVTTALGRLALKLLAEVEQVRNSGQEIPASNPASGLPATEAQPSQGFDREGFDVRIGPSRYA
ncbi:MAG: TVP38/TMEM64 family protein [Verrucomicrobiota bacterium]